MILIRRSRGGLGDLPRENCQDTSEYSRFCSIVLEKPESICHDKNNLSASQFNASSLL